MIAQTVSPTYSFDTHDEPLRHKPGEYVLRVRDLASDHRPRERMMQLGAKELSVAELMAIVWGVGTKKEDVLAMASRTLHEYGERVILHEHRPERLAQALDIPESKACQIIASIELGRRFFATPQGKPAVIRTADQAFQLLKPMQLANREQLRGLYVNSRYEVIHDEVISIGSLTANIVHPREVFRPAIEHGAVAVIVAHNHPSGDPTPTDADIKVTRQLRAAGKLIGIDLLDHLVIGNETYKSLLQETHDYE